MSCLDERGSKIKVEHGPAWQFGEDRQNFDATGPERKRHGLEIVAQTNFKGTFEDAAHCPGARLPSNDRAAGDKTDTSRAPVESIQAGCPIRNAAVDEHIV